MSPTPTRFARILVMVVLAFAFAVPISAFVVTSGATRADALTIAPGEFDFLTRLNTLRTSRGLAPLVRDDALAFYARDWTRTMVAAGSISHDPGLKADTEAALAGNWTNAGENVGRGGDVQSVHDAFVASPGHLANMINTAYNRVGIGVVTVSNGLYVTVRFAAATAAIGGGGRGSDPIGAVDRVAWTGPNQITVAGWALDPDTSNSTDVHVYVNGVGTAITANQARFDVAWAYPGYLEKHGFAATVNASPGTNTVCLYGINIAVGANALLTGQCYTVTIPTASMGALDTVTPMTGKVRVTGWTIDPDTAGSITIVVTIDGVWASTPTAGLTRPDVAAILPGYGIPHGYDLTVSATKGSRQVCTWATNVGPGSGALLGCQIVTIG